MFLASFQKASAKVSPPIGLLNDRKAVNIIETVIGGCYPLCVKFDMSWNRLSTG